MNPVASPSRRGFTLIELLVVISIIALLIGILLPALASSRESGRAVKCLSNLKQLRLGVQYYSDAYDEWWPVHGYNAPANWTGQLVKELQVSYVSEYSPNLTYASPYVTASSFTADNRNNGIFQCPTENGLFTNFWGGENATSYMWNSGSGTAWGLGWRDTTGNFGTGDPYDIGGKAGRVREEGIVVPGNTVVLADAISNTVPSYKYENNVPGLDRPSRFADYHSEGANMAWADGHASYKKKTDITNADLDRRE